MTGHVFTETGEGLAFVGDFAALYSSDPDPWDQSAKAGEMADYYAYSRHVLVESLWRHQAGPRGLEIGCGHGHLTDELNRRVAPTFGIDISEEAVAKASTLHPRHKFVQGDVTADEFKAEPADFVIWAQCLWYVLHRVDVAIFNTLRCLPSGGLFVVSQAFLREQRYGRDVCDGFHGAVRLFLDRGHDLHLVDARYDHSRRLVHHDGLLIFRRV